LVYLLKEKSEVGQIVKNFIKLVQTQFNPNVQVFITNNETEYFNTVLENFFMENGIVHQSTCVNSPQQNAHHLKNCASVKVLLIFVRK